MKQVGPYEVVRELGRGAMGVVFEVRHPTITERLALKMILDPGVESLERFRREAQVLGFLGRHPNIVGFREAGIEGGHPFIVMDFVEGETFQDALKRGMKRDHALRVLVQIARALHFAHEAEVIHRDLKPANVLLDPNGRAYLSDFGVAKSLRADRLTLTGEMVGTPAYMAPEQLDGGRATIDRRADVYALGAVLYEILSGVRPFAGDKISIVKKVLMDPPARPSDASQDGLPFELEELCLKCLAKAPGDRPPSAESFARSLEAYLGEGESQRAGPQGQRGSGWLATVGVVLLVGIGAGLAGRLSAPSPPPPPAATSAPSLAAHELGVLRGDADAVKAIAARADGSLAEALATARALCAAVRLDPTGPAKASGPRLVAAATALLAAVDPKSDRDAALVGQAWECLTAALVIAPTVPRADALAALDRLYGAPSRAVKRAASPWRALWDHGVTLDRSVVERALAQELTASVAAARRDLLPLPWGPVLEQVAKWTNWWSGRYVRGEVRLAIFAEFALRKPTPFLEFELAFALFQVGRVREASALVIRAVESDPGSESWYRAARILQVHDLKAAERLVRESLRISEANKTDHVWGEFYLIEILVKLGGAAKLEEARQLLEKNRLKGDQWRWWAARRVVARGLGEAEEPRWAAQEQKLRVHAIKNYLLPRRGRWTPKHHADVAPKGSK